MDPNSGKQKNLIRKLKHLNHPLSFSMATKKLKNSSKRESAPTERHLSELVPFQILVANETPTAMDNGCVWLNVFLLSTTQENVKNTAQVRLETISR